MSTSPLSAQDLRAAAEAHQELGPEYSDAVIDCFLAKVEARLEDQVNARLSELRPRRKRSLPRLITHTWSNPALAGVAIGAGGVGVSITLFASSFPSWVGPPRGFWPFALLLIASAICCGAGLARAVRRDR